MNLKTASLIFFFASGICTASAQDLSNKGKDFWVAYAGHIDGTTSRMALYITSDQNASGVVDVNGTTTQFTVTANQVTTVQLTNSSTPGNTLAYNSQVEGIGLKKGIHITADKPVAVYAHILNAARSGSTLVLPTNVLGKEYYVASYKSSTSGQTRRSQFNVVATLDNTTVQITPTQADGNGQHPANVPFTITLSKGDVYQYQSDEDLTGTYIKSIGTVGTSCQPIAVFSGSTFTSMGCPSASSGDNLYQQLFPFASWGKTYYTAPFISRAYDIFRILVQDPTEPVNVNGTALNPSALIGGRFYEINTQGNNTPRIITSNKPMCVLQYLITQGCDGVESDPEMVILNPVEQTLNDITVMSARNNLTPPNTNISSHYLNVIFKTNSLNSLRVDGVPPTATPITIPGVGYSYIQQNVTASTAINPAHRITSDSGFICIAYGYGNVESYGYNAGANVKDLYQFVSVQNQYATVDFPATCKGSPFYFTMTFPYQPTAIQWIFGTALNAIGLNDTTVLNPSYDSTWIINSKQLYQYKLPRAYQIGTTGTFPIKLLAQNPTPDGCGGDQEINYELKVFEPPVAGFNFTTTGCVADPVSFADVSLTNGRPSYKWFWNFGDGTTSSTQNPSHLYTAAGSYIAKMSVITDIGCVSDTMPKTVVLTEPPVANFGIATPACEGKLVSFIDSSSSGAAMVKWTWNFGDGSAPVVATGNASQSHTYVAAGTYTVTLFVENANGCQSAVTSKAITVSFNPVANFNFSKACLPNASVQFTDASTINDGTQNAFSYAWNFGNGGMAQIKNPSYVFSSVGPHAVTLTVTSGQGCVGSINKQVDSVYAQPIGVFTAPSEVCQGAVVNFIDNSSAANSSITGWQWDFGDGTPISFQQNAPHHYSAAGNYTVTLTATSAVGCVSAPARKQIVINALPVAAFTPSSPPCIQGTISFTDNSQPNAGAINQWIWDFGDGTTSSQQSPTHIYSATGNYNVTLEVGTTKGCVSTTMQKTLSIHPLPVPGFIMPGNCINDPITQFFDTSSIADGSQAQFTYLWNFGDANAGGANPNTSIAKNPVHKFTATGNYDVTLTVTSGNGCTSTMLQKFTINGAVPEAALTVQNGLQQCSNDSVRITDRSSVFPGHIVKLEIYWDNAGDITNKMTVFNPVQGRTYVTKYPEFFTPASKTYRVKMISYSGVNCLDELDTIITLKATPDILFTAINSVCANTPSFPVQASATNMTGGASLFTGTPVSSNGVLNPAFPGAGTYPINFTYTGTNGCANTKSQSITILRVPIINAGPDRFVLEGGSVILASSASGAGLTYLWSPGDYLNNAALASPVSTPKADIVYSFAVTTNDGCTASDQVTVVVLKAPVIPNVFSPNGDGINDRWEVKYLESYPGATVEIFNRYGQQVFTSRGYSKPWDGTYKGSQIPAGTYYYIIDPKNGRQKMAGYVDIIR